MSEGLRWQVFRSQSLSKSPIMFLMVQSMGKEHFWMISELDWALQTATVLKPSTGLEIKELESRDVERGVQGCAHRAQWQRALISKATMLFQWHDNWSLCSKAFAGFHIGYTVPLLTTSSKNFKDSKSLRIHLVPKLWDRQAGCWQGGSLQSVITDRWYQEAGKSRNASNKTTLRTIGIPEWTCDLGNSATRSQGTRDQWPRLWRGQEQNSGSGSFISHKLLLTTITTDCHPQQWGPQDCRLEGPEITQSSPTSSPGLNHLAALPARSSAVSHQLWGNAPASREAYSIFGQEHPPCTWQALHLSILHPSGELLTVATVLATTSSCWHCFHSMSLKTLKLFSTPAIKPGLTLYLSY